MNKIEKSYSWNTVFCNVQDKLQLTIAANHRETTVKII